MLERLIIGSSCWAAGQVLQGNRELVVIDRGAGIGREFFECYRECSTMDTPLKTAVATELQSELKERERLADAAALAPLMYAKLHNFTGQFRLWIEITGISRNEQGWLIEYYDVEGRKTISAKQLIDCTPECRTNSAFAASNIVKCSLKALVLVPEGVSLENSGLNYRAGRGNDEFVISVELKPGTGWAEARQTLLATWQKRPQALADAKIFSIAKNFDFEVKENRAVLGENYYYFNSASFANPLAAIDSQENGIC